jgi:hypothetical protein
MSISSLETYLASCPGQRDNFYFETAEAAGAWMKAMEKRVVDSDGRSTVVFARGAAVEGATVIAWLPQRG